MTLVQAPNIRSIVPKTTGVPITAVYLGSWQDCHVDVNSAYTGARLALEKIATGKNFLIAGRPYTVHF